MALGERLRLRGLPRAGLARDRVLQGDAQGVGAALSPGEAELAQQELALASEALREAHVLLDAGAQRGAASRVYYAVFHGARAALTVRGLYAKTHSGQITLFEQTFGAAPVLGRLFRVRGEADYGRGDLNETPDELRELTVEATTFLDRCRAIVDQAVARGPDEPDPPPDV